MTSRLNPDDQQHVEEYLQLSQNRVERKPFRPWLLLGVVLLVVIGKLVSVTGLVLSAAITTGIALAGTAAWRARVSRVPRSLPSRHGRQR